MINKLSDSGRSWQDPMKNFRGNFHNMLTCLFSPYHVSRYSTRILINILYFFLPPFNTLSHVLHLNSHAGSSPVLYGFFRKITK